MLRARGPRPQLLGLVDIEAEQFAAVIGLLLLSGCGGGESEDDPLAGLGAEVQAASDSQASDFPAVEGRSLEQMAAKLNAESEIGLATPTVGRGDSRLAFELITPSGEFAHGPPPST